MQYTTTLLKNDPQSFQDFIKTNKSQIRENIKTLYSKFSGVCELKITKLYLTKLRELFENAKILDYILLFAARMCEDQLSKFHLNDPIAESIQK